MNRSTNRYRCVIFGNPVEHSQSPMIQHHFAKEEGIDLLYERVCAPLDGLKEALDQERERGLTGANITVPFKEEIIRYCDHLTPEAERAQAVNTIRFRDGKIEGHNTDGIGLMADIEERKGIKIEGKRVLLLGAGGASRGLLQPLFRCQPLEVIISNRTFSRAEQLAEEFSDLGHLRAKEWDKIEGEFDLILNATSASLAGEFRALPEGTIAERTIGFDLMYSDRATPFMEYLEEKGAKASFDGMGMLIEQALFGFEYWFNVRPNPESLYRKLRG